MPIRIGGKDYDYDLEFVVDLTQWKPADSEAGEELFEYLAEVEYTIVPYCYQDPKPELVQGTAQQVFDSIEEAILEWRTLLLMNDCKDRKLKVSIHVEEVK